MRTLTDVEVTQLFGDIRPYILADGAVAPLWPYTILTRIPLPAPLPLAWDQSRFAMSTMCHERIAPRLELALKVIHSAPEVWRTINDWGGCYMVRPLTGDRKRLSRHSWGIAVDLDVGDNPYGKEGFATTHLFILDAFRSQGFIWGGEFSNPDPMHFEASDSFL